MHGPVWTAKLTPDLANILREREGKVLQWLEDEAQQCKEWQEEQDALLRVVLKQQQHAVGQVTSLRNAMGRQQPQVDDLVNELKALVASAAGTAELAPSDVQNGRDAALQPQRPDPTGDEPAVPPAELESADGSVNRPVALEREVQGGQQATPAAPDVMGRSGSRVRREQKTEAKTVQAKFRRLIWQDRSGTILGQIVTSPRFESFCALVIVLNALSIGYATEYAMSNRHTGNETNRFIKVVEKIFFAFYTMELFLKLAVFSLNFFTNADMLWNIFDLVLVLSAANSLLHEASSELRRATGAGGSNLSWMRLLRLLKMLRLLRIVRVIRFFQELRMMLRSIAGSLKVLFWSMVMLSLVMYTFGLAFLQATTAHLEEAGPSQADTDLTKYWGSLGSCCVTLYMAVTGGADWAPLAEPLWQVGHIYYYLFILYIALLTFAILNILTGIFAEAAMEVRQQDQENVLQEAMRKEKAVIGDLKRLFNEIDIDNSGAIRWEEFKFHLERTEVRAFLNTLELDASAAVELFRLLDKGDNKVTCEDFIDGCTKFKGAAKSIDIMELLHDTKTFMTQLEEFMNYFEDSCNAVLDHLGQPEFTPVEPLARRLKRAGCVPPGRLPSTSC